MPKQQPRRRGRPPRTQAEQAAAQERRIPRSRQGRLKFRPGDSHALDVQEREARNYHQLIAAKLEDLQATQAKLDVLDDPGVLISEEEHELKSYLWEHYHNHKHRDHIAATFLAIRRQRLLARLQAADDALQIAADLLTSDDDLLQDLRTAVQHQRDAAERRKRQPRTQPPEEEEDAPKINKRHLYGDVARHREQLAQFEAQVQTMRSAISPATGWYEEFFVKKVRMTEEAKNYLMRHEPIPPDIEVWVDVWYGPYLKYRWEETTGGPIYTIQMSLIPDEEIPSERIDDEESDNPWPNL